MVAGEGEAGTEGKGQGDGGRIGWGRKVELVLLVVWLKERTTHVHKNPSGCLRINQSSIFFLLNLAICLCNHARVCARTQCI